MKSWTYSINKRRNYALSSQTYKIRGRCCCFSCPGFPGCWSQGATEEEDLENIQDAIVDYLSVVDELTQESETRYVEVAKDAKTFGSISQKRD